MKLSINGETEQFAQAALSIAELLAYYDARDKKAAVAVNGQFVPRREHESTRLHDNDVVEIVSPMQGG